MGGLEMADRLGPVKPNIPHIARELITQAAGTGLGEFSTLYGYSASSVPEHSAGLAIDFMVYAPGNRSILTPLGDWAADYLWHHRDRLGLRWEIWRQRVRSTSPGKPGTWVAMADRGSATQNHYDHVHAFFWEKAYVGISAPPPPPVQPPPPPPAPSQPIVQGYQGNVYLGKLHIGQGDSDSVRVFQRALRNYPGISTIPLNPSGVTGYYGSETAAMCRKMYTTLNERHPGQGWGDGDLNTPGRSLLGILGCRIVG